MSSISNGHRWWGGVILAAGLTCTGFAQTSAPVPQNPPAATTSPTTPQAAPDSAASLKALRHSIDTGHSAEALKTIADIRARSGDMPGLDHLEGLALYAQSDLKGADTAFAAALKQDPNDIESAQMRGLTLFRLGRPTDAIPLLEFASSKGSLGKADPNYILALCYMDTRRYDDARHAFAAQFSFAPDSAQAYLVTARMLLRRDFLPIAQTFAQKSIELEPSLPLAHELLGEIALAGNHLDDAIAEFEKEKAHDPLAASIYDRLGDAYSRAAKYDDAQRCLQEAVLLEPNSTGPYILLGKTMLKKGDPIAAVTYLQHAEQMDPANYITHSLLGQGYRAMGLTEQSAAETATAQKLQAATEPKIVNGH